MQSPIEAKLWIITFTNRNSKKCARPRQRHSALLCLPLPRGPGGPTVTINPVKAAAAVLHFSNVRGRPAASHNNHNYYAHTQKHTPASIGCFCAHRLATSLQRENITGIPQREKKKKKNALPCKPLHCNSLNSCFLTVKPRLTLTDKGVLMQQA